MKNAIKFIPAIAALMLMTSCGSSEYDKGYNAGYADGVNSLTHDYSDGNKSPTENTMKTVTVYGDFTAAVRQLIPDYVTDSTTNRAAVITLFQDGPTVIRLNEEICSELQVGEIYTFEVKEEETDIPACQLFDDGSVSSDIDFGRLYIGNYRAPAEDEYGLESWRVKYK